NDYEVFAYYHRPQCVPEGQVGNFGLIPVAPAVIITPPSLSESFQPYADWLTAQGTRTKIVTDNVIYFHFPPTQYADSAECIREYMKYCHQYGGTYFILGGDQQFIPVRYCYPVSEDNWWPHPAYIIPTDFYFCDLTGNWNVDGDEKWGEPVDDDPDKYAEVFVGRVTAYNQTEVTNWVNKTLTYEKTPSNWDFATSLWIRNTTVPPGDAWMVFPDGIAHYWLNDCNADEVVDFLGHGYGFCNQHAHGTINVFHPHAWGE
ncbi:unnamed protein product, partial [marine sediment metagenome]